jgi:hypothetical protein
MKHPIKIAAAFALLVIFLTGCAMFQTAAEQPFTQWSPKKQLTYAINIYTTEYDKYMRAAMMPDLTEGQKTYLRTKRATLTAFDELLSLLIPFADMNQPFPGDLETQLLDILTRLGYTPM